MKGSVLMIKSLSLPSKIQIIQFFWQHILLLVSLYVMTLGVALCVRSNLGSSVISSIPMAFSLAGQQNLAPPLTIGGYTNLMNMILVVGQILVLRRRFEPVQLFQLLIGFVFGALIDVNMYLTSMLTCDTLPVQIAVQFVGCTVMAAGIALEVQLRVGYDAGGGLSGGDKPCDGSPFPENQDCGRRDARGACGSELLLLLGRMAVEHHRHRHTVCDVLRRIRGEAA